MCEKGEGGRLGGGFDGALLGQVSGLPTIIAAQLAHLAALHGNMANLSTPVALDFLAEFLDVTEAPAGVAFLLVAMVTVACDMPRLPAGVAALLALGLLAVPGDVPTPVAVIAGILCLLTISCDVTLLSAAVTEQIFPTPTPPTTPTSCFGAVLDPVSGAATPEAFTAAHIHLWSSLG